MTSPGFIIPVCRSICPGDDTLHYTSPSNVTPPKSGYSTQDYVLIWTITCGLTVANNPPHPPPSLHAVDLLELDSFIHSNFNTFTS